MAFEKVAIANAESCGIQGAYFYEGTMFFAADNARQDAIDEFRLIYPSTIVSNAGDEIAIDFTF